MNLQRSTPHPNQPVAESPGGLAWLYTILRFNFVKLVPLSIGGNYQSKDLAHCQYRPLPRERECV